MTEVPEYLLKRSRERREALGLGGGTSTPSSGAGDESTGAPPAAPPAVAESAPAAAPAAPAPAAAAAPATTPTGPPAFATTRPRSGIPVWMMPVILIFPLWAVVYAGAFTETKKAPTGPAEIGRAAYVKGGCGGCHGATGGGGSGPALAGGESKLTFPDEAAHIAWVENGSTAAKGQSYGDANRPGGPRPPATGGMPAFKGVLTDAEIKAVVAYERDFL